MNGCIQQGYNVVTTPLVHPTENGFRMRRHDLLQPISDLEESLKAYRGHSTKDTPCGACIAEGRADAVTQSVIEGLVFGSKIGYVAREKLFIRRTVAPVQKFTFREDVMT